MNNFSNISKIEPNNKSSWENKIFLTFDMDWAHDEIIQDTLNILNSHNAQSTWFVTHQSPIIEDLRNDLNIELGVHPNFNQILENINKRESQEEIIQGILKVVPEAKSIRSHSLTQNSKILDTLYSLGITHDVNHFIPNYINSNIKPWMHWNGLIKVPFCWEDDVSLLYKNINIEESDPIKIVNDLKNSSVKVFDFHPIHIFLNTESISRYEKTRALHNDPDKLIKFRFSGYGTRNRFIDVLKSKNV